MIELVLIAILVKYWCKEAISLGSFYDNFSSKYKY